MQGPKRKPNFSKPAYLNFQRLTGKSIPNTQTFVEDFIQQKAGYISGVQVHPFRDPQGRIQHQVRWFFIPGRQGTMYEGKYFKVQAIFADNFPEEKQLELFFVPLKNGQKFKHPNVYHNSEVCHRNLTTKITDLSVVFANIEEMIYRPNFDSPANIEFAALYQNNREEYEKIMREQAKVLWTEDDLPQQ